MPKHIKPTAAKTYLSCSIKFYFESVVCIRKKTPAALHLGKAVHAALQAFHIARWRGADDSPETIAAAAKPDQEHAAFDHEIQLVSYQLLLEAATGERPPSLNLVFLVKTKTPQVIRVQSPPADAHRKQRVAALLETAVEGIASNRHHPQPGMHCSWCQYRTECLAWLPGMTVADIHQQHAA